MDGGPPIKPVRESASQFLHAESSSNGFPQGSVQNSLRVTAESMVSQVERQTPEDMVNKFVSDSSARPPPHMRSSKVGTTKATTQTTTPQDEVSTVKKSQRVSRVDFQETAKVQKVQMPTRTVRTS